MEQELSNAAVALVGVAAVGSLGTWAIIGQRLHQHGEVIPSEPRQSVPWSGWYVLGAFLLFYALQIVAVAVSGIQVPLEEQPPESFARLMAFSSLFSLVAVGLSAGFLILHAQASQADIGLSSDHAQVLRDIILGAFGFMAATLPVLGIQYFVSILVEYDHAVLDMLGDGANNQLWLVALLSAVVVAPLTEEFLFRVVLQGWLDKVAKRTQPVTVSAVVESSETEPAEEESVVYAAEPDEVNPYAPSLTRSAEASMAGGATATRRAVWPIWASATIFALMHLGQGAAPIPLLFLGAILGYVYRQTHRLVPCVVLHALFNLFSLLIFRLSVQS